MIPTINKPTRITRNTNIVIRDIQHRSGIKKTDISDHYRMVFALSECEKVTQKMRNSLFINASMEKNK